METRYESLFSSLCVDKLVEKKKVRIENQATVSFLHARSKLTLFTKLNCKIAVLIPPCFTYVSCRLSDHSSLNTLLHRNKILRWTADIIWCVAEISVTISPRISI